jgi:hypothetical protein
LTVAGGVGAEPFWTQEVNAMDEVDAPGKPNADDEDQALAGAGNVTSGLECPTCGDRFPSRETLEEHLPTHKQL